MNDLNRLHYTILSDPADAAAVRTALGLTIGTNVQAQGATLTALEALNFVAGDTVYFSGADTPVRLPKGTAGQLFAMNSGATAPEWVAPTIPAGTIIDFGGATSPTGYLACDGAAVSRTTYAALFTAISTLWGVGDGSTTFNLPNFSAGEVAVQTAGTVGASTDGQMPAHTHPLSGVLGTGASPSTVNPGAGTSYEQLSATGSTGTGTRNFAAGKRVLKCIKT